MMRRSIVSILSRKNNLCSTSTTINSSIVGMNGSTRTSVGICSRRNYYDDETNKNDDGSTIRGTLSDYENSLYIKAKPRLDEYRLKHISLPDTTTIPKGSFGNTEVDPNSSSVDDDITLQIRRKRLLYRCMQRGWLEVDLLLGTWASQNVMTLSMDELNEFEEFVNSETIDIYNIITLRYDTLPDKWKAISNNGGSKTGIVERIQQWAKSNPLGRADPEKYKEVKGTAKLI
jgi:succinate dehydrogenase assembly factor 2